MTIAEIIMASVLLVLLVWFINDCVEAGREYHEREQRKFDADVERMLNEIERRGDHS